MKTIVYPFNSDWKGVLESTIIYQSARCIFVENALDNAKQFVSNSLRFRSHISQEELIDLLEESIVMQTQYHRDQLLDMDA